HAGLPCDAVDESHQRRWALPQPRLEQLPLLLLLAVAGCQPGDLLEVEALLLERIFRAADGAGEAGPDDEHDEERAAAGSHGDQPSLARRRRGQPGLPVGEKSAPLVEVGAELVEESADLFYHAPPGISPEQA